MFFIVKIPLFDKTNSETQINYNALHKLHTYIYQLKKEIRFFQNHNITCPHNEAVEDFVYRIAYSKYDINDIIIEVFSERLFFERLKYVESYPLSETKQNVIEELCQQYIDYGDQEILNDMLDKVLGNFASILEWAKPVYYDLIRAPAASPHRNIHPILFSRN